MLLLPIASLLAVDLILNDIFHVYIIIRRANEVLIIQAVAPDENEGNGGVYRTERIRQRPQTIFCNDSAHNNFKSSKETFQYQFIILNQQHSYNSI